MKPRKRVKKVNSKESAKEKLRGIKIAGSKWPGKSKPQKSKQAKLIGMTQHDWSKLNHLQLGKYAEHLATMRLIELGFEVYSTEVDDRGIDKVVRYAPGKCLEIQVKSVRGWGLTYVTKNKLGSNDEEIEHRLRSGYCLLFVHFVENDNEPNIYLVPGYAWLTPNAALIDNPIGDKSTGPYIELRTSRKHIGLLEPWLLTGKLVQQIITKIK